MMAKIIYSPIKIENYESLAFRILDLLKSYPNGLSMEEIATKLGEEHQVMVDIEGVDDAFLTGIIVDVTVAELDAALNYLLKSEYIILKHVEDRCIFFDPEASKPDKQTVTSGE